MRMLIYEVTVAVPKEKHREWLEWMRTVHIPDVLKTGCFTGHFIAQETDPQPSDFLRFTIWYLLSSQSAWDQYQRKYALQLQKEHREKFPDASAQRRLLSFLP